MPSPISAPPPSLLFPTPSFPHSSPPSPILLFLPISPPKFSTKTPRPGPIPLPTSNLNNPAFFPCPIPSPCGTDPAWLESPVTAYMGYLKSSLIFDTSRQLLPQPPPFPSPGLLPHLPIPENQCPAPCWPATHAVVVGLTVRHAIAGGQVPHYRLHVLPQELPPRLRHLPIVSAPASPIPIPWPPPFPDLPRLAIPESQHPTPSPVLPSSGSQFLVPRPSSLFLTHDEKWVE